MRKSSLFFLLILINAFGIWAQNPSLQIGADNVSLILSLLKNKRVGLVVNPTSRLSNGTFLVDTLIHRKVDVKRIFAPEHGFRGDADAGEKVNNSRDEKTGIEVVSLYGKNVKPTPGQLADLDFVVFDIQDVGARFYTYISTLHYVMEACAQNGVRVVVLDRPNPNDVIDGPVLDLKFRSFVGLDPLPVLYGLTIGELACMMNGERWLSGGVRCQLEVVRIQGWKHGDAYSLPVRPSPNLPNDQAIRLYPSLCFFEATKISVGRGTDFPFQVIGYPDSRFGTFQFTPAALPGFDKNPLQKGQLCYGVDLRNIRSLVGLHLKWLIHFYNLSEQKKTFFSNPGFMDKLAGTNRLRLQIVSGKSINEIRQSWQADLDAYKKTRKKYLLYAE
ncbi:MAG: DUF1343 domain-containing protein [Dysgonamonadaceae bacterium]